MSDVETIDLGRGMPKTYLALPERFAAMEPPEGTPHGYGVELWHGKTRTRTTELVEYRMWHVKDRERCLLRICATPEGWLVGIYDGELDSRGGFRRTVGARAEEAAKIEEMMLGILTVPGIEPTLEGVLRYFRDDGLAHVTRARAAVIRKAAVTTPPLYRVAWQSFVTAAALCWWPGSGASTRLTNWTNLPSGERSASATISIESLLRDIEGGARLLWWRAASDRDRAELSASILRSAVEFFSSPPPWHWWAGTPRRTGGWVLRDGFTGRYKVVGLRSWRGERSGIQTVVRRLVKPPPSPQREFCLDTTI